MTAAAAADQALLNKLNAAVAEHNAAEQAVTTAQSELVSKSKIVGQLLLEARKQHPKLTDFEAFLKRVNGLKLSRAYDLLRLAGGRVTDEELREESRERQRRSRAKKAKIPLPAKPITAEPKPEPISVTTPPVTESQEISIDQRRAENARLDDAAKGSADYLAEFRAVCLDLLPKITDHADQMKALTFVQDTLKRLREEAKHKRRAA